MDTLEPAPSDTGRSHLGLDRRLLAVETVVVVGIGVGLSCARSVLNFVKDVLAPGRVSAQSTVLNGTRAPDHPWIDLGFQLVFLATLLLPVALVLVLLVRGDEPLRTVGLRTDRLRPEVALGVGAAATVGGIGLAGYLAAHAAGLALTVVPAGKVQAWWYVPVLVAAAVANAALEEVVFVGYLVHRLEQLGVGRGPAVAVSAGLRGAYHLYQGLAGCLGNALMGAVFAGYFARRRSIVPQVVAHATIDVVAFLGYLALAGHVSWLPTA